MKKVFSRFTVFLMILTLLISSSLPTFALDLENDAIESHNLVLTYMQNPEDTEDNYRIFRIYHKDSSEDFYPLEVGYSLYDGPIIPLGTLDYSHNEEDRFTNPFLFQTSEKIGVDSSDTYKLYWYNEDTEKWVLANTKQSASLYKINFDPNGGELISGELTQYAYASKKIEPPIVRREGYDFIEWNYSPTISPSSVNKSSEASAQWYEIPASHNLNLTYIKQERNPSDLRTYRVFHKDSYDYYYPVQLGYQIYGETGIVSLDQLLTYNYDEATRNTEPYLFDTQTLGIESSESVNLFYWHTKDEAWKPVNIKASASLYEITYLPNGGLLESGQANIYAYSEDAIEEPIPTRLGYNFEGWEYNATIDINNITKSAIATAQWSLIPEERSLNLTFMNDESPTPSELRTYRIYHKDSSDLFYPAKVAYKISGQSMVVLDEMVSYNNNLENRFDNPYLFQTTPQSIGTSETVIIYHWNNQLQDWIQASTKAAATLYQIDYDPGEGMLNETTYYAYDKSSFDEPIPTRPGYTFEGWKYTNNFDPQNVTTSASAEAIWQRIPENHTLRLTYIQNESPTPEDLRVFRVFHKDESDLYYDVTLGYKIGNSEIITLETPFTFDKNEDGRFINPYLFETNPIGLNASETLVLYWFDAYEEKWVKSETKASASLYEINYDPNGGNVDEETIYVFHGNNLVEPVPSRPGYTFEGWTYDTEINLNSISTNASAVASWTLIPPTPTPTPAPAPTPAPVPFVVISDELVELEYGSDADDDLLDFDLDATVFNSGNTDVTWSSSDEDIATVDEDGIVTAVSQGEVTITVTHTISGATDTGTVIVFLVGDEETPLGSVAFFEPYIVGYPDGTFKPGNFVTRAEVATIFARILNLNVDFPGQPAFTDVPVNTWYYANVQAVQRAGIFNGTPDGKFKPESPITREEIANVFNNYFNFSAIPVSEEPSLTITDVGQDRWSRDAIYKVVSAEFVDLEGNNTFRPEDPTLRHEIVSMVNRLIGRPAYTEGDPKFDDVSSSHPSFGEIEAASQNFFVTPE